MSWSDNERDAHITAIYHVLFPVALLTLVSFFLGLLAYNVASDPKQNVDAITWSLTVIEIVLALFAIMLGVVAIFGFWAVRGAAIASAKREARTYLDEKAGQMFEEVLRTRQTNGRVEKPVIPDYMDETIILKDAVPEDGNA
jgi:uncharacterized BrkB/YihY/UPF0761 family membrane protein